MYGVGPISYNNLLVETKFFREKKSLLLIFRSHRLFKGDLRIWRGEIKCQNNTLWSRQLISGDVKVRSCGMVRLVDWLLYSFPATNHLGTVTMSRSRGLHRAEQWGKNGLEGPERLARAGIVMGLFLRIQLRLQLVTGKEWWHIHANSLPAQC